MTKSQYRQARALIADPRNWTQGVYFAGSRLCSLGACMEVAPDELTTELSVAALKMGKDSAVHLNDTTDHATVLRMFDLAIEMAEEE